MHLDTTSLLCFIEAARQKSFTAASATVGRTQSAVSQQIAKLENSLGQLLFKRGKNLELTHEGEIFLSYAHNILKLHQEVFSRFNEPSMEGEVQFGLPEDFATVYLADLLAAFSRSHPRIYLNVTCDLSLNLFARFQRGEFDLVLAKMSSNTPAMKGQEIWSESLEWVGLDRTIIDLQDPIPLVLAPEPCVYRTHALQSLNEAGIRWRLVFTSPSYTGMCAAVKAGMGITVFPRMMMSDGLHTVHHEGLPKLRPTQISLFKRDHANPALASFEQFVIEQLTAIH